MFVASWGDKRKQFVGILFKNEKREKTIVSALLFEGFTCKTSFSLSLMNGPNKARVFVPGNTFQPIVSALL